MIKLINNQYKVEKSYLLEKLKLIAKELGIKGHVVIKLGDKAEAHELNKTYLKRDYPTDVLSFPFNEKQPGGFYVGDIFICYPAAEEQAQENNITTREELLTLMIHGLLHLAKYDHETDQGEMDKLQEKLVNNYVNREEM